MKLTSYIFLTLFIYLVTVPVYPLDYTANDVDENRKYDREHLLGIRDNFIAENGDLTVIDISVTGLTKTRKSVILKETGVSPGDRLSLFDPHRLTNRLRKKNLFTEIGIGYAHRDNGVVINIDLKEKWTIIPIPMFYDNGESTVYGVYILESNFWGYGKIIFTGGTYSEHSKSIMLGLIDPSVGGSRFAGNIFLIYKNEINHNGTVEKKIFSEYMATQKIFRIDAGYNFTDNFKLLYSTGYHEGIVYPGYSGTFNPPQTGRFYLSGILARIDYIKYYEYLFYGFKGEIDCYSHIPAMNENFYYTIKCTLNYSHKIFDYHRLTIFSSGGAGDRPGVFEERISGKNGTRTLPADIIAADNYLNYSIIYEYPFLKFSRGAVTLLALWEQGIYNIDRSEYCLYYGPGTGIVFYLKHISFPAFGFNYARNIRTGNNEFSVNLGYMF